MPLSKYGSVWEAQYMGLSKGGEGGPCEGMNLKACVELVLGVWLQF